MAFDFWRVDGDAFQAVRADGTGQQFTRLMNALLTSEAAHSGLSLSELHLNLQINLHDGGADATVSRAVPADTTGWMQSPTVWQYKLSPLSKTGLKKEINKPSVREYIEKGFAYRLCVCDEEAPPVVERKERDLAAEQDSINPSAPPPRILTASSLATWVSRFPALVLTYFRAGGGGKFLDLNTWKANITKPTPTFVLTDQWKPTFADIQKYVDFGLAPQTVPFLLKGEAGVGKTRLGFEALAALPGSAGLVIYCDDEQEACATDVVMRPEARAILVADECDVLVREKLKSLVAGFQNRLRVVAINVEAPSHSGGREYFLRQLESGDVDEVLKLNFAEIPSESRRRYAELCGGFIGLAADMCEFHPQIAASGDLGPAIQSVENYYRRRLPDEQRKRIEVVALVSKVGFKREKEIELEELCRACGVNPSDVKQTANDVHSSPGFVGIGGSYLYVRPKIIARVAFGEAWHRWGSLSPEDFLAKFPPSLVDKLIERVNDSAPEEVGRLIAGSFREWAFRLRPKDLTDQPTVERLCALTETRPEDFLPRLRLLVEQASIDELLEIKGEWLGTWGPRRSLVWLCERLAAFPSYFDDVEPVLLRLAIAESEPTIGNNGTHIWTQLFRILLSGTSIPFKERLVRLKERIYSEDERVSALALRALNEILNPFGSRMGGPLVVAGRIPPDEWKPKGREGSEAVSAVLDVVSEMGHSDDAKMKDAAIRLVIEDSYNLLVRGYLEKLQAILEADVMNEETKARLVGAIEHFLHLQSEFAPSHFKVPPEYLDKVTSWKKSLELHDLRGKMLTLLGVNDWGFSGARREEWLSEIRELAKAFFEEQQKLISQFDWLFSTNAKSSALFGEQVGKLDRDGQLLDKIVKSVAEYRESRFARGYLFGFLSHENVDLKRVNELLDWLQGIDAQLAYELFIVGGARTRARERTLAVVKSGKLSVRHFRNLGIGAGGSHLNDRDVVELLDFLQEKMDAGDAEATETAIDIVAYNCLTRTTGPPIGLHNEEVRDRVWKVAERAAANVGRESFWWGKIVEALAPYDLVRAARVAAEGLLGEGVNLRDDAGKVLSAIAQVDPAAAMEAVGAAIMDEAKGWRFLVGRYDVIKQLPPETVIEWIDRHGVEAARRIARQLPTPYLLADGTAVVPPLTEHVLTKFGEDKRVFNEFVAGVHDLQLYVGDIAGQKLQEGEIARKFLKYPLPRIQEWAQIEIMDAESQAAYWRDWEAEQRIE